jgi:hypothetical protein
MTNKKFLFIGMAVLLSASLFFLGCDTGGDDPTTEQEDETGKAVTELVLTTYFAKPEAGTASVNVLAGNTQYTGAVAWKYGASPDTLAAGAVFAQDTVYTAEVTLTATGDYTFAGVAAKTAGSSAFTYADLTTVANAAGTATGITVTVVFPATKTAAQQAEDLKNALTGATVSGTTVTLGDDFSVTGTAQSPTVVPVGVTLATGTYTLTVADTKGLSVAGIVTVAGKLDVAGTLNVTGAVNVEEDGEYVFQATGTGTSTGNITIESGGEVVSVDGSDMAGTGWTVVQAGGKAYKNNKEAMFVGDSDDNAMIRLASGSVSTNNSGYALAGGAATLLGDFGVTDGKTLSVAADATLNVFAGSGILNVEGVLDVAGTLNVAGAVNVKSGGEYVFQATGTGTSTGDITVKDGGEILSIDGSNMTGTGKTIVQAGGKSYTRTSAAAKVLFIGATSDTSPLPIIKLTTGSLSRSSTGYELNGDATLYGEDDVHDDTTYWYVRKSLNLEANSILRVPGGADSDHHSMLTVSFANNGTDSVTGAGTGANAAKIILGEWGYLGIRTTDSWNNDVKTLSFNNFYTNNSTKVAINSTRNTTFTWSSTLGSGGWLATQP